jgi:4-amino-4-deoxy-L-arabinose transferase-like glycosyltransferase
MTDALLLVAVLAASAAAGLLCLRLLRALPEQPADRLLPGLATGLGLAGVLGLALAAVGELSPVPLLAAGALALAGGGRELGRSLSSVRVRGLRRHWPLVAIAAAVVAVEACTWLAPPIGGDQTKYHLVYPRLYAQHHGLVPTPWTFWGQMQFLPNFLFAVGFALSGDVLARFLNGATGVLAALAVARLVRRHMAPGAGAAAGVIFLTLPITWTLMTRAGSDLAVVLYAALTLGALLEWTTSGRGADLRLAALMAGLAGGSKTMGLLVPALAGLGVLAVLTQRGLAFRRMIAPAAVFGLLAALFASPCYVRNAVETGNPLFPFGYGVFGGDHWSAAASQYLDDYYHQYQTVHAQRREASPYVGLAVVKFPWDLTMHPDSFENAARQSLDVSPFALAFAPALLFVRRRRRAVLLTAAFGLAYAGIIAGGAWAHPRYVVPGVILLLAATVPAARALLGPRPFVAAVALTIAGNLALTSRLLRPLWPDQARVALGRLAPVDFLRRHSDRFAFWERANAAVPPGGSVLVLEKIPHPYYIERPFVLGSYLEQGMIDYRTVNDPQVLAEAVRGLGVTHVALEVSALDAAGDPFEAAVGKLWRAYIAAQGDLVLREQGYALYALRPPTAVGVRGSHG